MHHSTQPGPVPGTLQSAPCQSPAGRRAQQRLIERCPVPDAASMDERSAEVVRIAKVLQQHAAALEGSTAAQAAEQSPDPYELLGIEEEASAGAAGRGGVGVPKVGYGGPCRRSHCT